MKTLQQILIMAACLFGFSVAVSAQEPAGEKPFKVYCQLVTSNAFLSSKITVDLDFGQMDDFWGVNKGLVDSNGKDLKFNNIVDALNYFGERGWEVVDRWYEQKAPDEVEKSSAPRQFWLLSKTVTSKEQILDGLLTYGQYKAGAK